MPGEQGTVEGCTVLPMATPHRGPWTVPMYVIGYLVVIGAGLLVGAVGVWLNYGTGELFVTILAALAGLTMLGSAAASLTVGRGRPRV